MGHHKGKWQSSGQNNDYWAASFNKPMKVNFMKIQWSYPPTKFKVSFKFSNKSEWVNTTNKITKYSYINKQGRKSGDGSISYFDTVLFHKPLITSEIKIELFKPINGQYFGIEKVRFYQTKTTCVLKNETFKFANAVCWVVNTDTPRPHSLVESTLII